jgi:hypothetical protein
MHLLKLDLSHQQLITEKFRELNFEISEYTFANIYLFRDIHHYQLFFENELFLKGVGRDGSSFLMPTNRFMDHMSIEEMRHHLAEVDFFYPIPEQWLHFFDPAIFNYSHSESDSDYLFSLKKIRTQDDTHSNAKSNLIRQLFDQHTVKIVPLDREQIPMALSILTEWQKGCKDPANTDYASCKEAIEMINTLQLTGLIAYVDDEPGGFIIGEEMAKGNYAIHFAKGKKSIKGIYQYLYQALAESLSDDIKFLNFEQDMGLPNLQQAKHSYHPDRMVDKWRVSFRKDLT